MICDIVIFQVVKTNDLQPAIGFSNVHDVLRCCNKKML